MKLRNKKTGEYGDYKVISAGNLIRVHDSASDESWQYDSLASFNEKWEDYKSTEPLIKDEEVRTMVRLWAKHHNSSNSKLLYLKLDGQDGHYLLDRKALRSVDVDIETLKIHDDYTITELCGEKEE